MSPRADVIGPALAAVRRGICYRATQRARRIDRCAVLRRGWQTHEGDAVAQRL